MVGEMGVARRSRSRVRAVTGKEERHACEKGRTRIKSVHDTTGADPKKNLSTEYVFQIKVISSDWEAKAPDKTSTESRQRRKPHNF